MSTSISRSSLNEIAWWPIVVAKEDPRRFVKHINSDSGWISDANPEYRFDIVLALEHPTNVCKIKVDLVEERIPAKIEFRTGIDRQQIEQPNYESSKNAEYQHCGVLRFRPEKGDDGEMESRILTVDVDCRYIWMIISEPLKQQNNPHNQIGFKGITVYGHPLAAPVQQHRPGGKAVVQSKTSGSRSPSSASNRHAGHKRQPSSIEMSAVREGRTERSLELSSSRTAITQSRPAQSTIGNDGLVSVGDRLGEEPLLCVRTVRKILIEKHQTALEADRPVEAGMCLRAIERLDEAEAKIVRLRSQVRDALSVGETQEATRCQLAMSDIRDAVFRVAQIDLLLNRHDLRAVGIISKWATE